MSTFDTALTVLVSLAPAGWLVFQGFGELRYYLEFRNLDSGIRDLGGPLELRPSNLPPMRAGAFVVDAEVVEP